MAKLSINLTNNQEIAQEFLDSFTDCYEIISNSFMRLDEDPSNHDETDNIFRALHTLKGNADMCQISSLTSYIHAIEDIVSALREEELLYSELIAEVTMLALDKARNVSGSIFSGKDVNASELDVIEHSLTKLASAKPDQLPEISQHLIALLSGHIVDSETLKVVGISQNIQRARKALFIDTPSQQNIREIDQSTYANPNATVVELSVLNHFRTLFQLTENNFPYWKGRIDRTLPLVLAINKELDNAVNSVQLEAAIYVHDLSFAYLENCLVLKDGKYNEKEMSEIKTHPELSSAMLRFIPGWEDATTIVEQHHEKWDGNGYPNKLINNEICLGSQILAIVDAYESMTNPRPDRQYKRSVLRAVTEINNCVGKQFSPDLTLLFNKVVKRQLTASKNS